MPRVTTREASQEIRQLRDFTTNGSLKGAWQNGAYVVTSYSTAIAHIDPTAGVAYLNRQRYSVTTSRHQGVTGYAVQLVAGDLGLEIDSVETAKEFLERIGE